MASYQQLDDEQVSAEVPINENMDALGQAFLWSHKKDDDTGLTVGFGGGNFDGNTVANATVACTDDATNYIVAHRTTRALSVATNTTNWDATTTYGRVGRAVFASSVLTYHDERDSVGGIFDHSTVGGGTVTSVDASGGVETVSGSAITATGTVRGAIAANAQTGTSYTYLTTDRGKLVTHSNGSAIAGTLPQAGTAGFETKWYAFVQNRGAGTLTITPTTSTIDGSATLALTTGQGALIVSDGTNYFTLRGGGTGSGLSDGDKGDVTVSASGATWTIDAGVVTYAKMQDVSATDKVLGRSTAGSGDVEEIACTAAGRALLAGANAAAQRTTLSLVPGTDVQTQDAFLQDIADLTDPGADRLMFWDDSAGEIVWLTLGTGLTITGTTIDATGSGSTVGKHAVYVSAGSMQPSVTGGCAPLETIASASSQPDIMYLAFDATTQEYAQFGIVMPKSWNEGTLTFKAHWSHPSTTTNFGVVWDLQAVAVGDDDAIAVAYGTAQTSTDTGGTTNDLYASPESSAITVAGTPATEDMVFFRLSRVTGNGSDTMAVDARLHGITLYMTTDADTDA
jgi:hypothetical protein